MSEDRKSMRRIPGRIESITPPENVNLQENKPEGLKETRPDRAETREERLARKRANRKKLDVRNVLMTNPPPGYFDYWVHDRPDLGGRRIQAMLNKGYEFVYASDGP